MMELQPQHDWFSHHIENWRQWVMGYRDQPSLRYLEIGVAEGRSLFWMFENVLTHPTSHAVVIDHFVGPYTEVFFRNLEKSGLEDRIAVHSGRSQTVLRTLDLESVEIAYIDGSHEASDVLEDAVMCWGLVRSGGIIIFDDYLWTVAPSQTLRPKMAIDAFLAVFHGKYELIHKGNQVAIRKI